MSQIIGNDITWDNCFKSKEKIQYAKIEVVQEAMIYYPGAVQHLKDIISCLAATAKSVQIPVELVTSQSVVYFRFWGSSNLRSWYCEELEKVVSTFHNTFYNGDYIFQFSFEREMDCLDFFPSKIVGQVAPNYLKTMADLSQEIFSPKTSICRIHCKKCGKDVCDCPATGKIILWPHSKSGDCWTSVRTNVRGLIYYSTDDKNTDLNLFGEELLKYLQNMSEQFDMPLGKRKLFGFVSTPWLPRAGSMSTEIAFEKTFKITPEVNEVDPLTRSYQKYIEYLISRSSSKYNDNEGDLKSNQIDIDGVKVVVYPGCVFHNQVKLKDDISLAVMLQIKIVRNLYGFDSTEKYINENLNKWFLSAACRQIYNVNMPFFIAVIMLDVNGTSENNLLVYHVPIHNVNSARKMWKIWFAKQNIKRMSILKQYSGGEIAFVNILKYLAELRSRQPLPTGKPRNRFSLLDLNDYFVNKYPNDIRKVPSYFKNLVITEDLLKCSICKNILDDPQTCKNGHCFCLKCVSPAETNFIKCPKCLTNITEPGHVVSNEFRNKLKTKNLIIELNALLNHVRDRFITTFGDNNSNNTSITGRNNSDGNNSDGNSNSNNMNSDNNSNINNNSGSDNSGYRNINIDSNGDSINTDNNYNNSGIGGSNSSDSSIYSGSDSSDDNHNHASSGANNSYNIKIVELCSGICHFINVCISHKENELREFDHDKMIAFKFQGDSVYNTITELITSLDIVLKRQYKVNNVSSMVDSKRNTTYRFGPHNDDENNTTRNKLSIIENTNLNNYLPPIYLTEEKLDSSENVIQSTNYFADRLLVTIHSNSVKNFVRRLRKALKSQKSQLYSNVILYLSPVSNEFSGMYSLFFSLPNATIAARLNIICDIVEILIKKQLIKECFPEHLSSSFCRTDLVPNDVHFEHQWSIGCAGPIGIYAPNNLFTLKLPPTSDHIRVAVVDSGVHIFHHDLHDNIFNFIDKDGSPVFGLNDEVAISVDDFYSNTKKSHPCFKHMPLDTLGHGTHVAGIIGALVNNGIGIAGIAGHVAKIVVCRTDISLKSLITCINFATDHKINSRIVNLSLYTNKLEFIDNSILSYVQPGTIQARYNNDMVDVLESTMKSKDAIFVVCAGNHNAKMESCDSNLTKHLVAVPACFKLDNIIVVSATDEKGERLSDSNYGSDYVDLSAPGSYIVSTFLNNSYTKMSGTSMAAPHVSAVLALMMSQYPELSNLEIKNCLFDGCDQLGGTDSKYGRLSVTGALEQCAKMMGSKVKLSNDADYDDL